MSLSAEVGLPALYRDITGTIPEVLVIIPQLAKYRENTPGTHDEAPACSGRPCRNDFNIENKTFSAITSDR